MQIGSVRQQPSYAKQCSREHTFFSQHCEEDRRDDKRNNFVLLHQALVTMVHQEAEVLGLPRSSGQMRKKSEERKYSGGRVEYFEDEERYSSSSDESDEDPETQRKVAEIKRKWREKDIIPGPVAQWRINGGSATKREVGKKPFKLGIILLPAVISVIIFTSLYQGSRVADDEDGPLMTSASLPNDSVVLNPWEEAKKELSKSVKVMEDRYPSQSLDTWSAIFSAVSSTLAEQTPGRPSSLVLLTPPGLDLSFTLCFAQELGKATHSLFSNATGLEHTRRILQVGPQFWGDWKTTKEIHDELSTYLNNDGKVVIVHDLQHVNDPARLMIFYQRCHFNYALDPRATFIFLLRVSQRLYDKYEWLDFHKYAVAKELLNESWSCLTLDQRPVLISIITQYVGLVNLGDSCSSED